MSCRVCGGTALGQVIDLGPMPLVNSLLDDPNDDCPRWPLSVVFCRDCSLAQLTETVPPDLMFSDYRYFSSQSETTLAHGRRLAERFVRPGQRIVEIGSNDGYLLKPAAERGASVLGVDPAENIAAYAQSIGVPTVRAFFNRGTAEQIRGEFGPADAIFANNVLAHVPDPNEIAAGIGILLAEGGTAHLEMPYLLRLIESRAFDTIYHEHYSYFTVSALRTLFNRHDLRIVGIEEIPLHGGSLHVQVARGGDQSIVDALCEDERECGLFDDACYEDFAGRVNDLKRSVLEVIDEYKRVAGFGAAAKGIVLLNVFSLGPDRVPWVADVSPHKVGRYVPGTGQPIVEPARLLEEMPDACLLLPWNIAEEITTRNRQYVERGGRFIVPVPEVMLL